MIIFLSIARWARERDRWISVESLFAIMVVVATFEDSINGVGQNISVFQTEVKKRAATYPGIPDGQDMHS